MSAKPLTKKRVGRPSKFTAATARTICRRIAGGESLATICTTAGMPTQSTVRLWLIANDEFSASYARARDDQAEYYAAEIIEIADKCTDAAKARLQIDARKWYASKLAPKKYGDKIDVEHSGSVDIEVTIGGDDAE